MGDVNPTVFDTTNGVITSNAAFPYKNNRFSVFSRDRTYLAGTITYRPSALWSAGANAAFVFEQQPRPASYYQVGIGASVNY